MGLLHHLFGGLHQALIELNDFPWDNSSAPNVQEYLDALHRYRPGVDSTPTLTQGWAAAKIFEKALDNVGATASPADVLAGLWSFKNETIGGLTPPLTFARGRFSLIHRVAAMKSTA